MANAAVDGISETSRQLRASALHATDSTAQYIRDEPIKSVLIAPATGAAFAALISILTRPGSRS